MGFKAYGTPWSEKDSTRSWKGIYAPKGGKKQNKQKLC